MHSSLVRVQNVFGLFTTVAFCVAGLISLSVVLSPQAPKASLVLKNVQVAKGRPHYYSKIKEEYANIKFDLDADLSSLFNWNTKQVFLYITATYPSLSPNVPPSTAIVWDAVLPSALEPQHPNQYIHPAAPSNPASNKQSRTTKAHPHDPSQQHPGIVRLKSQKPKYQISDASGRIAGRGNATLELRWNVQPWVGALTWTNGRTWGVWKGLSGGRSAEFAFPGLRSAAKREEMGTARGGEGNRGRPA
ncbi:Signal peptidase complex subunit [Elasticomyces elasticus]|nr:Signal peptidase complex subunit [Elasticomyces elasticus]